MRAPVEESVALARVVRPVLLQPGKARPGRDAHRPQIEKPADEALVQVFLGPHRHLHVPGLLGHRQLHRRVAARGDDLVALGDIEGHRLLEVHVLAGSGRQQGQGQVGGMRRGDDHDIDVRVSDQRLRRGQRRCPELSGESGRTGTAGHGHQPTPGHLGRQGIAIDASHIARAKDPEADRLIRHQRYLQSSRASVVVSRILSTIQGCHTGTVRIA